MSQEVPKQIEAQVDTQHVNSGSWGRENVKMDGEVRLANCEAKRLESNHATKTENARQQMFCLC
jgi:hypothetical protein